MQSHKCQPQLSSFVITAKYNNLSLPRSRKRERGQRSDGVQAAEKEVDCNEFHLDLEAMVDFPSADPEPQQHSVTPADTLNKLILSDHTDRPTRVFSSVSALHLLTIKILFHI